MYKCHRPTTKKAYWLWLDKELTFKKAVLELYNLWLMISSRKNDRKCILEARFRKGDKETEHEFAIKAEIGTTEFLVHSLYEPLHASFVWKGTSFKEMIKELIRFHVRKGIGKMYCLDVFSHCREEREHANDAPNSETGGIK